MLFDTIRNELLLFAASGFVVFGVDDLLVDLAWLLRARKRGITHSSEIAKAPQGDPLAIFIPAWREAGIIEKMLARCLTAWADQNFTIFVGHYPNDPATRTAISIVKSDRIIAVEMRHPGPTTKADCLNGLWRFLVELPGQPPRAVVIHDAEDYVHRQELALFRFALNASDYVQIPVVPLAIKSSRWISGHYLDEFAEAHLKELPVRQMIGASLPTAGTGCAFSFVALKALATQSGGGPFDADSLTEDYELGLRLGELGYAGAFVRANCETGVVAVRSHFPATLETSIRQKSRWIVGIALCGWDRTGWHAGLSEHWMRWRDRRAILAALLIVSAYFGLVISLILNFFDAVFVIPNSLSRLLGAGSVFVCWRLAIRAWCTYQVYGICEALRALPRAAVSNLVAVMASYRALILYLSHLRGGKIRWEKTEHLFPVER